MAPSSLTPARAHPSGQGYSLALLGLLVAFAGLGAAYGLAAYADHRRAAAGSAHAGVSYAQTIGPQRYLFPSDAVRTNAHRVGGFAERIDLALTLPLGPDGAEIDLDVTILQRARARTSASLLDAVYLHQFGEQQLQGPPGLVGKPLVGDAGYRDETVWYDPLHPNPFVAKCMRPIGPSSLEKNCLRTVILPDRNAAIYAFNAAALVHWRRFDAAVEARLAPMRR